MEGLKHAKLTCIFVCNHWKLQLQSSRVHGLATAKFFAVSIKDLKCWQCWGGGVALTFFAFQPAQLHLPTATCQNTEAKTLLSGELCFSQEIRGEIGSKNIPSIPKSHKQWLDSRSPDCSIPNFKAHKASLSQTSRWRFAFALLHASAASPVRRSFEPCCSIGPTPGKISSWLLLAFRGWVTLNYLAFLVF